MRGYRGTIGPTIEIVPDSGLVAEPLPDDEETLAPAPPPPGPVRRVVDRLGALIPPGLLRFWPIRMTGLVISLIRRNRVMSLAAEIGFWGVLSVVPLLLVLASALGWFDAIIGADLAESARRELAEQVTVVFGTDGTASTSIDNLFQDSQPGTLTFGLLTGVYAASRGFTSLVGALGLISGHRNQRNWLMTRVVGVFVLLLSIIVLVALLIFFGVGRNGFGLAAPWAGIVSYALWPIATIVVVGWATVLLHAAPRERTPVIQDLPGAALTALLWIAGTYLTAFYIRETSSSTDVLGLLGSGVGLLIWLYVVSASILIGAQLNAALQVDRDNEREATVAAEVVLEL